MIELRARNGSGLTGFLAIVGLGPGDPELVTVKAVRLIREASTIVHFAKSGASGHARTIAGCYMADGAEEIRLTYPFTTELAVSDPAYRRGIDDFHDTAASGIVRRVEQGERVVLLCEGDPFFYGSAMHVFDRLRSSIRIEIVPGITAMSGAWSGALTPIAHGDDVLSVLPGTLDDAAFEKALCLSQALVVIKLGRNLPRLRGCLDRAGVLDRTLYVEHATAAEAHTLRLAERDPLMPAPYFSLLLIPGRRGVR